MTTTVVTYCGTRSTTLENIGLPVADSRVCVLFEELLPSLWFNILNAGTEIMVLPATLTNICTVRHGLFELFRRIIVALQYHGSPIVFRCPSM